MSYDGRRRHQAQRNRGVVLAMSIGRLFITGGGGFTGIHLLQASLIEGWDVKCFDGNLNDEEQLEKQLAFFSPDAIVHLAAISLNTHADSLEVYKTNVLGTEHLLQAAVKVLPNIDRIILASSASVYGIVENGEITEDAPTKPITHYGISKLAMEHVGSMYSNRLPITTVRPFNYTGHGHGEQFVVPKIVKHYLERRPVVELGNVDVTREFNDVRDVVRTYLQLLKHGEANETYNICSGNPVPLRRVVSLLEQITGHSLEIKINPAYIRPNDPHMLAGSPKKVKRIIEQSEPYSLGDTLSWMLQ